MSVYRDRISGNWFIDFWWRGHRIKESTHQKSKPIARQMEAARKADLARGVAGIERRESPEFRKFFESDFLPWFKATHPDHPRTSRRHQVSSRPLLEFFSGWLLSEIDQGPIEKYKAWRIVQKSSVTGRLLRPATVNRELAALRAVFNLALKHDLVKVNPVRGLRFFREDNEQTCVVSYEEEAKYLQTANTRLREVSTLILNTGMRPEEVYRCRRGMYTLRKIISKFRLAKRGRLDAPFRSIRMLAFCSPIDSASSEHRFTCFRASGIGPARWGT